MRRGARIYQPASDRSPARPAQPVRRCQPHREPERRGRSTGQRSASAEARPASEQGAAAEVAHRRLKVPQAVQVQRVLHGLGCAAIVGWRWPSGFACSRRTAPTAVRHLHG
jgi:hypothetical protein